MRFVFILLGLPAILAHAHKLLCYDAKTKTNEKPLLQALTLKRGVRYSELAGVRIDAEQWKKLGPAFSVDPDRIFYGAINVNAPYEGALEFTFQPPGDLWVMLNILGPRPSDPDREMSLPTPTPGAEPIPATIVWIVPNGRFVHVPLRCEIKPVD